MFLVEGCLFFWVEFCRRFFFCDFFFVEGCHSRLAGNFGFEQSKYLAGWFEMVLLDLLNKNIS
jgi:hypothetical protein